LVGAGGGGGESNNVVKKIKEDSFCWCLKTFFTTEKFVGVGFEELKFLFVT
jgi:hypothetical protein